MKTLREHLGPRFDSLLVFERYLLFFEPQPPQVRWAFALA